MHEHGGRGGRSSGRVRKREIKGEIGIDEPAGGGPAFLIVETRANNARTLDVIDEILASSWGSPSWMPRESDWWKPGARRSRPGVASLLYLEAISVSGLAARLHSPAVCSYVGRPRCYIDVFSFQKVWPFVARPSACTRQRSAAMWVGQDTV